MCLRTQFCAMRLQKPDPAVILQRIQPTPGSLTNTHRRMLFALDHLKQHYESYWTTRAIYNFSVVQKNIKIRTGQWKPEPEVGVMLFSTGAHEYEVLYCCNSNTITAKRLPRTQIMAFKPILGTYFLFPVQREIFVTEIEEEVKSCPGKSDECSFFSTKRQ